MKKSFRRLLLFLLFASIFYYFSVRREINAFAYPVNITIEEGEGVYQIAKKLESFGLIKNKITFLLHLYFSKNTSSIRAQSFTITQPYTTRELTKILTESQLLVPQEVRITFLEGWTQRQYAKELDEQFVKGFGEQFLRLSSDATYAYDFLKSKPVDISLEGYLFPDTYNFYVNAYPGDVVIKLLDNFDSKLTPELREEIARQGRSIHDVITLASILEREVRSVEDKKLVADIFYKRLGIGMALQADSTVNYATGKNDPSVLASDLKFDSPYNTYLYQGIPPGPISNPGLDSILAAVYPDNNEYWYFLTTLDTGEVIYSKTFDEHVNNKQKYL